ncbi:bifunctional diguanylate cyclase/phosphodiesterase [Pseudarthrobacter sp. PS3-L1]|uniref:putative bifunctional diguanylate cyclase/phosphodiesterase n=1 Tax=Pseudarthrobacter sp. PS3-L1 TaxID=3046207 RepID=UPI0024BAB09D|nr:bifunctional diguanylate cyclase/phosphodiesterase [Pseudarthrobacter sp. PS3-L1]MDJ0319338.1 bifunctional diguanylate cyclase/phosphodiesterase [Pseudarthrobacter sp. PS3-L1]
MRDSDKVVSLGTGRERQVWIVVGFLGVIVVSYAAGVLFRKTAQFDLLVDGVLSLLTMWGPALVCWWCATRRHKRSLDVGLVAAALAFQAAGDTYYVFYSAGGDEVPVPSLADIGYVGFYLLMLAALFVVVYRRLRTMTWPVVLDCAVGTLGAGAALVVILGPILAPSGTDSGSGWFSGVYPLLDLMLFAVVVGIAATPGRKIGREWTLLALGLLIFTAADVSYAFLELDGMYIPGTPLDATWALGTALIGCWAVFHEEVNATASRHFPAIPVQTIPALATATALGVLIIAALHNVLFLAVVLASLTLALAAVPLVFRQRMHLLDLTHQARTDELTGLHNRRALYADVPPRLAENLQQPSAILLLDIDKFKEINDGLGHDVGDDLLRQVSARLAEQLRPVDLLARMGGDEFVAHVADCSPAAAQAVAVQLRESLARPYDLSGVSVQVNASIGISCFPSQGVDLSQLLRKADMAMYGAKSMHTGYLVYSESSSVPHDGHFHTVQDLNHAFSDNQLILHFQPKVNLLTGQVSGVEALVRWNHPILGVLPPDAFLRRFEEAGLMPSLTEVVLGKALDQAAVWEEVGTSVPVAVNLPAGAIMDSLLPARVAEMCGVRGLQASVLIVEITEDVLVADRERARTVLAELRRMGVRIAVDDFGKGFSSLSYLRELPIDELKLDKSFILTMMDDARATALVVSTIDLAHSMGLQMTAEGVENEQVYRALTDYGCDLAQGYFMSRPVPAQELTTWFRGRGPGFLGDGSVVVDTNDQDSIFRPAP